MFRHEIVKTHRVSYVIDIHVTTHDGQFQWEHTITEHSPSSESGSQIKSKLLPFHKAEEYLNNIDLLLESALHDVNADVAELNIKLALAGRNDDISMIESNISIQKAKELIESAQEMILSSMKQTKKFGCTVL